VSPSIAYGTAGCSQSALPGRSLQLVLCTWSTSWKEMNLVRLALYVGGTSLIYEVAFQKSFVRESNFFDFFSNSLLLRFQSSPRKIGQHGRHIEDKVDASCLGIPWNTEKTNQL